MKVKYQVTGNDYLSLPTLREADGAIEGLTFLHMGAKGMLEMRGMDGEPLLKPIFTENGQAVVWDSLAWERAHYWIPSFTAKIGSLLGETEEL